MDSKTSRVGGQGEGESDKDYCLRMLQQYPQLSNSAFEILLGPAHGIELAKNAYTITLGLATDDPETYARFAEAWSKCLASAEVTQC